MINSLFVSRDFSASEILASNFSTSASATSPNQMPYRIEMLLVSKPSRTGLKLAQSSYSTGGAVNSERLRWGEGENACTYCRILIGFLGKPVCALWFA